MRPVLIVIEGGIADVRHCPPGVQVIIKDYDVDDDTNPDCRKDPKGSVFNLKLHNGWPHDDQEAEAEAFRIARKEIK